MKRPINQPIDPFLLIPTVALGVADDDAEALADMASRWAEQGIAWLHLAAHELPATRWQRALAALTARGMAVQVDAALATSDDVGSALASGAARVVVDAALGEAERRVLVAAHGAERLAIRVAEQSAEHAVALATAWQALGVTWLLYRDEGDAWVRRLGRLGAFAQQTEMSIIAEIGAERVDQLLQLRWLQPYGVVGTLLDPTRLDASLQAAQDMVADRLPHDAAAR
ncbi:MAG: hypothetical protein KDD73_10030 [Anaerolineales bacterium]|nr:hypothetical protein [Anaerolineales bacterium]MCB9129142.1 hypothetical protein [Ardenticatenales bacterium]